jgi:RND family efflux transporter MFP subunit
MKKSLFIIPIAAILTIGCQPAEKTTLDNLNVLKDNLKERVKTLSDSLALVEELITAQDTSKKLQVVTIDSIEFASFEHYFEVHGNVKIEDNAQIFPEVPGKIEKILVKEGSRVNAGTPLIQLDASTITASIAEVQKQLELAKKVFEKQSSLWEQKIGSEIQFLEAKTNKEGLEKRLASLQEQVEMYTIKAPFSGTVDEIMPKVGEAANPAMPVTRIINLDKVYIEAEVSERYIKSVKAGTLVKISFPGVSTSTVATVSRVGDYINPANRTFKVQIILNNNDGSLKPNLLAVLKIRDYHNPESFNVPSRLIQQDRQGNNYIYTLVKNDAGYTVKKLDITLGQSYDGVTEIKEGVDQILPFIDKGSRSVKQGDIVAIQ